MAAVWPLCRPCDTAADSFRRESLQPTHEEPLFSSLMGEGECAFEGGARGAGAAEPLEQVGAGRVCVGIVIKIAGRDHRIERREPGFGPIPHGERSSLVERHNGRRLDPVECVVKQHYPWPVRALEAWR